MSYKYRVRGLVASMESEQDVLPVNTTDALIDADPGDPLTGEKKPEEIVFPEGAETTRTEMIDMARAGAVVEAMQCDMDDAVDVVSRIEGVSDVVQRANENGGMPSATAELLSQSLESLYYRVGIISPVKSTFSLEAFATPVSRVSAGVAALEDIKQNLKTIWENIVKAVKIFGAKVKEFFQKAFSTSKKMDADIKKAEQAVLTVSMPNSASTINNPRLVKALAVGTSIPANLGQSLQAVQKYGQIILTVINEFSGALGKQYLELLKNSPNLALDDFWEQAHKLADQFTHFRPLVSQLKEVKHEGDFATYSSEVLPGNARFIVTLPLVSSQPADRNFTADMLGNLKMNTEREDVQTADEVPALNKAAVSSLLPIIDGINQDIAKYGNSYQQIQSIRAALFSAMDGLATAIAAEQAQANRTEKGFTYAYFKQSMRSLVNLLDLFPRVYVSYATTVMRSTLDLVELSMRAGTPPAEQATTA